jgi:hypothetical protein
MDPGESGRAALRRCVLAVSVIQDIDLIPVDDGVILGSGRLVPWHTIEAGLAGHDPELAETRAVLTGWLRALGSLAWRSPDDLAGRARPVGLPRGHGEHPGAVWTQATVPGDVLDLGVGLLGIGDDPDQVVVVKAGLLEACGHAPGAWWQSCVRYLEEMGELAASRYRRDPLQPLRPMGDCDVVTLLGSAAFRRGLVGRDSAGMRATAMPTRRRGWLDLSRIDPAFALVAATLADDHERGFDRPLLITAEEVVMARRGGDPILQALRDAAAPDPIMPAVRYR